MQVVIENATNRSKDTPTGQHKMRTSNGFHKQKNIGFLFIICLLHVSEKTIKKFHAHSMDDAA